MAWFDPFDTTSLVVGLIGATLVSLVTILDNCSDSCSNGLARDRRYMQIPIVVSSAQALRVGQPTTPHEEGYEDVALCPPISAGCQLYSWCYGAGWTLIAAALVVSNRHTTTDSADLYIYIAPIVACVMIALPMLTVLLQAMQISSISAAVTVFLLAGFFHAAGFMIYAFLATWHRESNTITQGYTLAFISALCGCVDMYARLTKATHTWNVCVTMPFAVSLYFLVLTAAVPVRD